MRANRPFLRPSFTRHFALFELSPSTGALLIIPQDLLRPSFPGMMRHVRKNFHHIVFFLNPVGRDATTKGLIKHAESFLTHNTPLRIGVVLVSSLEESIDGKDDAAVAAVR